MLIVVHQLEVKIIIIYPFITRTYFIIMAPFVGGGGGGLFKI